MVRDNSESLYIYVTRMAWVQIWARYEKGLWLRLHIYVSGPSLYSRVSTPGGSNVHKIIIVENESQAAKAPHPHSRGFLGFQRRRLWEGNLIERFQDIRGFKEI